MKSLGPDLTRAYRALTFMAKSGHVVHVVHRIYILAMMGVPKYAHLIPAPAVLDGVNLSPPTKMKRRHR